MTAIIPSAPGANGPWRILVLNPAAEDPHWAIATVSLDGDVRPAALDSEDRYTGWVEVSAWVRERLGHDVALVPIVDALAWTVRSGSAR